jgi:hypothetical protein
MVTTSLRNIALLAMFLMLISPDHAYCESAQPVIQYVESADLSFEQLTEKISFQTGYQIELVGEWPGNPIQISLQGISLEDGLKRIIKKMGAISHILIFDSEEKKLKIVRLKAGVEPDKNLTGTSAMFTEDGNINPTPGSGEYGLTP